MIVTNVSINQVNSQENNKENNIDEIRNFKVDPSLIFSANNSSENTLKNGTLVLGDTNVNITYEQDGALPIFEGDIILPTQVVDGRAAIDKFIVNSPWIDGIIPVLIHPRLPNPERVYAAMTYLNQNTPVEFRLVDIQNGIINDPNFIFIAPHESRCSSPIGMMDSNDPLFTGPIRSADGNTINGIYGDGKYHGQMMNIADWCDPSAIAHEFGHALGLWHEQTRCDRDQYVDIVWSNIPEDFHHNFEVICDPNDPTKAALSPISYGEYDYCSIMHYPRNAVQSIDPNQPIIIPKSAVVGCDDIGITQVYSQTDLDAISAIYSDLAQ